MNVSCICEGSTTCRMYDNSLSQIDYRYCMLSQVTQWHHFYVMENNQYRIAYSFDKNNWNRASVVNTLPFDEFQKISLTPIDLSRFAPQNMYFKEDLVGLCSADGITNCSHFLWRRNSTNFLLLKTIKNFV